MISLLVNLRRWKINKLWYECLFLEHLLLWYMLVTFDVFFTVHHLKVLVAHSVAISILGEHLLLPLILHLHVIQLVELIQVILELLVHLNLLIRVISRVGLTYSDLLCSWIIRRTAKCPTNLIKSIGPLISTLVNHNSLLRRIITVSLTQSNTYIVTIRLDMSYLRNRPSLFPNTFLTILLTVLTTRIILWLICRGLLFELMSEKVIIKLCPQDLTTAFRTLYRILLILLFRFLSYYYIATHGLNGSFL